jgi:hypothetical protein
LSWQPTQTPEQEASYEKRFEEMPATPDWILGLRKDTLYKGSLNEADKETVEVGAVKPSTPADAIMMHIFDEPAQFAAISGPLLATEIKDRSIIPRVPTSALPKPAPQTTDKLRMGNITDPYLPSVGMTPHELAIVPRQRSTTQLPPHLRLDENIADSQEHIIPVETLVNAKIAEFHVNEQRLPHGIKVSFIRFCQNWINTRNYKHFNYHTEYGDREIPITGAAIGEFAVDEVRLD